MHFNLWCIQLTMSLSRYNPIINQGACVPIKNEKEWTSDAHNNVNESQKHAEWLQLDSRVHPLQLYLCGTSVKTEIVYGGGGCLGQGVSGGQPGQGTGTVWGWLKCLLSWLWCDDVYIILSTLTEKHTLEKSFVSDFCLFLWTADGIRIFSPTKKFHTDLHSPLGLQMAWSKEGTFRAHGLSHAKK